MTRAQIGAAALPLLLLAYGEVLARPLDSSNPTTRSIQVEFEISPDLTIVGQVYAPPIAAQYSASGNVGTVVIPSAEYEAFVGWPALSISDITLEIDLTTLEAQVVDTAGSVSDPPFAEFVFSWNLDTTQSAGFVDLFEPLHCSSQAQVDSICVFLPVFCGATCVLVPGAGYDAASGKLNMVGFEFQSGCGEAGCLDVNQFLARGDLRLTESGATSSCGDGSTDTGNGEECDDGNTTSFDGCSSFCELEGELIPTLPLWSLLTLAVLLLGTSGCLMRRRLGERG